MREHKYLPAQFNDRIAGFSIEMLTIFFAILVVIFQVWHPLLEVLTVVMAFYLVTLSPMFLKRGINFGKKVASTMIVDMNNQPISLARAHLREFTKWILGFATLGIYFVIAFYIFSKRQDRRTPHDLVFKTKVVYQKSRLS